MSDCLPHDHDDDSSLGHADALAGQILESSDSTTLISALEEASRAEFSVRQRVVDLLWLDALLSAIHGHDLDRRGSLVDQSMKAIRDSSSIEKRPSVVVLSEPARPISTSKKWRVAVIGVAVAVALMLGLWQPQLSGPRTALAAVNRSVRESESSGLRMYRVVTTFDALPLNEREMRAELYVRGSQQFLLHQRGPLGWFWVGHDGTEYWLVPAIGPVLVGDGSNVLKIAGESRPLATPILQVTSILERMADRYELTLLDEVDLTDGATQSEICCQHIRGVLRASDKGLLPNSIELWSARQNGLAHRLVLQWNRDAEWPGPSRVELTLEPTPSDLPSDWLAHGTHHRSDRAVIRSGPAISPADAK